MLLFVKERTTCVDSLSNSNKSLQLKVTVIVIGINGNAEKYISPFLYMVYIVYYRT